MQLSLTYQINESLYKSAGNHNLLLETIRYRVGRAVMIKQVAHDSMNRELSSPLFFFEREPPATLYLMESRHGKNRRIISEAKFAKELLKLGENTGPFSREAVEELFYRDRRGRFRIILVEISRNGSGARKAEIAFESEERMADFKAPPWLIPSPQSRSV